MCEKAAEQNDADSQHNLATCYGNKGSARQFSGVVVKDSMVALREENAREMHAAELVYERDVEVHSRRVRA